MGVQWSQTFPPIPGLTEANLPRQDGKIFIVTGGTSGIGFELACLLYGAGGKVYVTARSEEKADKGVRAIQQSAKDAASIGKVDSIVLDLSDLSTIKPAVEAFLKKETKVDVLWNNAGISSDTPISSKSKQGHSLIIANNCFGPLLFTQCLLPALEAAASTSQPGAVRIVWTSSFMVDGMVPKGGYPIDVFLNPPRNADTVYTSSKLGNWYLASEMSKEVASKGILSISQNPGNLRTPMVNRQPWFVQLIALPLLYPPKMGAYTELYAGLSGELGMADGGGYIIPWGRKHPEPRQDLLNAMKSKEEGGTGFARDFWEWCCQNVSPYRE